MKHQDLTQYITDSDDCDTPLECYFDDYTMSLWHVYVNDAEIYNLLSDTAIKSLERDYEMHVRKERREHNLCLAVNNWELRQLDRQMGI